VINNQPKCSYAQKVKEKVSESVLIIQPKNNDQNSMETQKQIKEKIDPTEVEVQGIRNVRRGGVLLSCKSKKDVKKLQEVVEEKMGDEYQLKIPEGMNPQVKIVNITEKWDAVELKNKLKIQNNILKNAKALKVCKIETSRNSTERFNVVVEMDGNTFEQLMNQDRIYVGWDRCRFFEHMNVRRCFNCKGYKHKAEGCRNKKACAKCAEEHDTMECKNDIERCVNCILANKNLRLGLDENHCAWSMNCQVYKKKENEKRKKIAYSNE
jgi:phage-related protein